MMIGTARSDRPTNSPQSRNSKVHSPNTTTNIEGKGSKVRRQGHWSQEYSMQRKNIGRNFNRMLKTVVEDGSKRNQLEMSKKVAEKL